MAAKPRTRTRPESSHALRNRGGPPRVSPSAHRARAPLPSPTFNKAAVVYRIHTIRVIQHMYMH